MMNDGPALHHPTLFLLLPLQLVLLKLLGQLLLLLLLHVAVQVFGGVAERRRQQDLSVLAQLVPDADEELLQLHRVLEDLRVRPAEENAMHKFISWFTRERSHCTAQVMCSIRAHGGEHVLFPWRGRGSPYI